MIKFTRFPILACVLFSPFSLSAQSGKKPQPERESRFTYEVSAGFNLSTSTLDAATDFTGKKVKPGFQIGAGVHYNFSKSFFIGTGLYYTTKGMIVKGTDYTIGGPVVYIHWEQTINQNYLQLPLAVGYKIRLSDKVTGVIRTGPYIAYGIGGKAVTRSTFSGAREGSEKKDRATFGNEGLKENDYGWHAGIGATIGKISIMLNYEIGIPDIDRGHQWNAWLNHLFSDDTNTYKNRNASLTVGYRF